MSKKGCNINIYVKRLQNRHQIDFLKYKELYTFRKENKKSLSKRYV